MDEPVVFAIDLERCIGCNTCVIACKVENELEVGSGIRVETVGGHHRDTPAGVFPHLSMHYRPILCMHCTNPPCLEACPAEAIVKREDGIVLIDEDSCDGCRTCLDACPYGVLTFDPEKDVVFKCTFCAHRLDRGEEPFCVKCCEAEAIFFGNLNDPESTVSQLVVKRNGCVLEPEFGTDPRVYYLR